MKDPTYLSEIKSAEPTNPEKLLALALGSMVSYSLRSRNFEEAEILLAAARRLWPDWDFLQSLEPFVLIASGRNFDALCSVAGRNDTVSVAVRAHCMYWSGELHWEEAAKEVLLRNDSARANDFIRSLFVVANRPIPEMNAAGEVSRWREETAAPSTLARMRV